MRNNGKGGMQTSGTSGSLCCPKCGKGAARIEYRDTEAAFMHFGKSGSVWHIMAYDTCAWRTERGKKTLTPSPAPRDREGGEKEGGHGNE